MQSNNHLKQNHPQDDSMMDLLHIFLKYWIFFPISIIVCVACAYVYLKYTVPEYKIVSSIIVKDGAAKGTNTDISMIFSDLSVPPGSPDINSELELLQSKPLLKKVADTLGLDVSYIRTGNVKNREVYTSSPVKVKMEEFKARGSFIIEPESQYQFKITSSDPEFLKIVSEEESFESPWGRFSIRKVPDRNPIYPITILVNSPSAVPSVQLNVKKGTHNVVFLSMLTPTPQKGIDILNMLVEEYNIQVMDDKNYAAKNTIRYVEDRLAEISGELDTAELKVENFRKANNITDIQSKAGTLFQTSEEYSKKISELDIQLNLLRSVKERLFSGGNKENMVSSSIGITDPTVMNLINTYNSMLLEKDQVTKGMQEGHPTLISYNQQVKTLEENLIKGIRSAETTLESNRRELKRQGSMYLEQMKGLTSRERESNALYRQQTIKENMFIYLLQKKDESALALTLATPNAKVINSAENQGVVKPQRNMIMMGALSLGFILPIIFIYFLKIFDIRLRRKEELLRMVKAPFLGDIPLLKKKEPLPVANERALIFEKFRTICANLDFVIGLDKSSVVMVTSSQPGEGKSFFSSNLALSLAFSGKKTLLLDLDIRKSEIINSLNVSTEKGVTVYLSQISTTVDEIIDKSKKYHKNLDIIPVKIFPPNPAELLSSDRLKELLEFLKTKYDIIVIDTAPIGIIADAYQINHFANACIFVTRLDKTLKSSLKELQDLYQGNKLHNLTCVLNCVPMSKKNSKEYGYYYA